VRWRRARTRLRLHSIVVVHHLREIDLVLSSRQRAPATGAALAL